jgi:aryl-alcohol dehydrogenase-like predicted oxidoreductase
MQYATFGRRTGLRVSELSLGTGNFGTAWGYGSEREDARAVFDAYVAAGGNFIDTANRYQLGQSEEMVGDFIAADRDYFVLATKYTLGVTADAGLSRSGNSRKNMIASVEASLRRLKTDRIDVYWTHFTDGATPMEEILRAFDDLVRAGKILYAGLSNFPAWRVARADAIAELRGWAPIVGIQIEYSLVERGADRELLPMAEALGLGAALWSPLGGGLLSGKYRNVSPEAPGSGPRSLEKYERETEVLEAVIAVAADLGVSPSHVAIAWLLAKAHGSSTALVPILGARNRSQLDATLGALHLKLEPGQVAQLDAASAITLGAPYEMVENTAGGIAGGQPALLRPPVLPAR